MNQNKIMLSDEQMAKFTAKGFLVFDSIIPDDVNKQFLDDIGHSTDEPVDTVFDHYSRIMEETSWNWYFSIFSKYFF